LNDDLLTEKLILFQNGDAAAFEQVYTELKVPAFTIIMRMTRNTALSEDILQEFFLKLYQQPFNGNVRNPRAYIFQMVRNLTVDSLRKQVACQELDADMPDSASDIEHCCEKMEAERAIRTLSLTDREIVTMHINAALKFKEIAQILGMPLGTVLWRYHKAIKQMQMVLEGENQ